MSKNCDWASDWIYYKIYNYAPKVVKLGQYNHLISGLFWQSIIATGQKLWFFILMIILYFTSRGQFAIWFDYTCPHKFDYILLNMYFEQTLCAKLSNVWGVWIRRVSS